MKFSRYISIIVILFQINVVGKPQDVSFDKTVNEYEFLVIKYEKENNVLELAKYRAKLGYLYMEARNFPKAIDYFLKAVKNNEDLGNINAIKNICINIGLIYSETEDYEQAITYFQKSLRINEKQGKKQDMVADLINIALALQSLKKYDESVKNLEQALSISQEMSDLENMKHCYSMLAENYDKLGNTSKSKEYFELAASIKSHLQKEELKKYENLTKQAEAESFAKDVELKHKEKKIEEMTREQQLTLELLGKQKELNELKDKEFQARERERKAKEKYTQLVILSLTIIILLVSTSLLFNFRQLREKKKANQMLELSNQQIVEQNKEIEIQRDIATSQKKKITDSILYAKRIQTAILPPDKMFEKILPEYFVLFKPRDIVSGDFYWMTEKEGIVIIAAADCTGHGVPGAFMSVLGVAYLNEIVNKIAINKHIRSLHANEILNQLRQNVIDSLHQTGKAEETKDGMDISLCVIDIENKHLQYAGAHNPVYIVRNNELIQLEADKMPIGIYKTDTSFTNHELFLEYNDMIYLFSDGYYDQFGGHAGTKFFSFNFRKLLLEIHQKPLNVQKQILDEKYEEWKGSHEQLDDVMVIGLKIIPHKIFSPKVEENAWPDKIILIAEDVDINYFLLVEALKPTKTKLVRVTNGEEAVEYCRKNHVDLILMDIRMPVMDGREATMLIKQFNKNLPIIAQTAQNEPGDKEILLNAGCDDFIAKPIDQKLFISLIRKHLLNS